MRNSTNAGATDARAREETVLVKKVEQLLADGSPNSALDLLNSHRGSSQWLRNAIGVCQLRLGNVQSAFEIYRQLAGSGVLLRQDAPTVFKTNLATAMLLLNKVAGCLNVLAEIHEDQNASVQRLRTAIKQWKASLSLWERLRWFVGDEVNRQVILDFPLGELWYPDVSS